MYFHSASLSFAKQLDFKNATNYVERKASESEFVTLVLDTVNMAVHVWLLLAVSVASEPRDFDFFVTSTVDLEMHAGTQSDPFTGLDQALTSTRDRPEVSLSLIPASNSFRLATPFQVENELTIAAAALVDLHFSASVGVLREAHLTLVNVSLSSEGILEHLLAVEGELRFQGCVIHSCAAPIVVLHSGYFGADDSSYEANEAVAVQVVEWNAIVELSRVEVRGHVGTFVSLVPAAGSGRLLLSVVHCKASSCAFRETESLFHIKLPGDSQSGGNVTVVATEFSHNAIPLFAFDVQGSSVSLSDLLFESNSAQGLLIAQRSSDFQFSNSRWHANQGTMMTITSLTGIQTKTGTSAGTG